MGRKSKGHAIMISIPYQGHINPFINLALKLASKGFTSGPDIRYTTITDGLPLEFDRELRFDEYWEIILRDFSNHVDEFVGKMIQCDPSSTYFLVADTLYPWPSIIADKYSIVSVSFWTQPAMVFTTGYHWDLLTERGHFPSQDKFEDIDYIPGIKSINTKDLSSYFMVTDFENIFYKVESIAFRRVKKADFILHNTVEELEPDVLPALNQYQPNYAIGPINFSVKSVMSKSLWSESDCTRWLESKSPGSVLYVSFGSFVHTSKETIEEIAYGLLLSGVDFIWAIREGILDTLDANALPFGFENEAKDKGLVVPWCDQIRVLLNPAIGGFLTHCGWNSTVESIWCGVPMICYPIAFDQLNNRKLVVDDWKIGISLCEGILVDRNSIAERIKSFMNGAKGLKVEAEKVKRVMQKAVEVDGSSERNFDRFVSDLEAKLQEKTGNGGKKDLIIG
ncbi:UDP-Glycosyltransferase superfamily protein [Striga asiatica]|uniref:Glycosyltransferase n=1 Tax=Striga asiatica TaxID=4170 RepID=A0A5A7QKM0_STRAF|nr:UDP-Glycosyltransferase superfamily protein [Striga asiatica]